MDYYVLLVSHVPEPVIVMKRQHVLPFTHATPMPEAYFT